MPGLNKTPEEWSNLEWAVNCTDICARRGLEWSREQDGCVDLSVCGADEALDGCQADSSDSGLGPDSGGSFLFYKFLTRFCSPFSGP